MLICIYEDRPKQMVGVKLLILSLTKHCPNLRISLISPKVEPQFRQWLTSYPQVELQEKKLTGSGSYNIKPAVLLDNLKRGEEECVWIDTDIIINGDITPLLEESAETVIVTQDPWEYPSGSTYRAQTWKLEVGRDLPGAFNSSVVRVTHYHIALMEAWLKLTQDPEYLRQQTMPARLRNGNMLSDQDIISALLASKNFSHFPVKRLQHPQEILQHHGAGAYGFSERLITLTNGLPPFIHAMGTIKPWQIVDEEVMIKKLELAHKSRLLQILRIYYEQFYIELSPYVHLAQQYRETMEEPDSWLVNHSPAVSLSMLLSGNHPSLKGAIQASVHQMLLVIKSFKKQLKKT